MSAIPQVGAIAVRTVDGSPFILLVTAKQNPTKWIFPKGHIEKNESPQAAALRELREEAGIEGELLELAGTLTFHSGSEVVCVDYYLIRFLKEIGSDESRQRQWCNFEDALKVLSFGDARQLLLKVRPLIDEYLR